MRSGKLLAGVVAYALELLADSRLFRPIAEDVGPARRPFITLAERG